MHKMQQFVQDHLPLQAFFDVLYEQEHPYPADSRQLYFTTNHDENSWNGTEFEKYGVYAEALAVFSFLYSRAVPLVYSGQEIPNRKRLAFFETDSLEWPIYIKHHVFYRKLANLRKRISAEAALDFLMPTGKLLGFRITDEAVKVLVWLNLDSIPQRIHFQPDSKHDYIDWMNSTTEVDWDNSLQPGAFKIILVD
jgi:hypothetical protein